MNYQESISNQLRTPILFLVYNRPNTTQQVFETIKKARPSKLYIAADGPKENKNNDSERVKKVRDLIISSIDWRCEVKTLFREKNLGCKYAPYEAINWFFDNEEMGIVLEDDTLPSQSFFGFCDELLERYKDDTRIGQICGFNALTNYESFGNSYLYSKFGPCWGWASWRRAWLFYDVKMDTWPLVKDTKMLDYVVDSDVEKRWRIDLYEKLYNNKIDTWDYQWGYAKLINSMLSVIPSNNLIKNIGFGEDATHTNGIIDPNLLNIFDLDIQNIHYPISVIRDKNFDIKYLNDFAKIK